MKKIWFYIAVILAGVLVYQGMTGEGASAPKVRAGFLEEDGLTVSIKTLSAEESRQHLQADLAELGYQAVQISIENKSKDAYLFSQESIQLPLVEVKQVAGELLKTASVRSLGFKIAGLVFWPLGIPGTIDSLWSLKNYRMLKEKWTARAVKKETVPPYSVFHRVFFVPIGSYTPSFTVTMQNEETLETQVFQVEGDVAHVEPLPIVEENYYLTHEQ